MFIANIFRSIFRVKRVKNLAELCAYIRKGDLDDLAGWIRWRIKYVNDRKPSDEWQSADVAIKAGHSDCEEKAVIGTGVIRSWGGGWKAENLYINNCYPGKAHAVTFWWHKREKGIIDGRPKIYHDNMTIDDIVKENWPAARYYSFKDSKGKSISEKVYLWV